MMEKADASFETLKTILKNFRNPGSLDEHPWTRSLVVQETLEHDPQVAQAGPGQHLVRAVTRLFLDMQPPAPPRNGKRLDPRWGEFGLLAALYFTPVNHGTPFPTTLLEAWKRIDPAILYQVFGKPVEALTAEQAQKYQLVGDEIEYGSTSTLSDWHKKGLQRLTEILLNRERFLSHSYSKPSIILGANGNEAAPPEAVRRRASAAARRITWLTGALLLAGLLILGGLKARQVYGRGMLVYQDAARLQELAGLPGDMGDLDAAASELANLRTDLTAFKEGASPLLRLSSRLGWVPIYGGDLAAAPDLIELAERLVNASEISLHAARPLLEEVNSPDSNLNPASLTGLLVQAQPELRRARGELDLALAARGKVQADLLSPGLRDKLEGEIDPLLDLADQGLSLATSLPGLLGATREGPKTYLLLAQNEDELRPTGGFITSVGNLVLANGRVIDLDFEAVDDQEDWSRPYPAAPWQLREYMNSRVLILRDSNWFADFPTTAQWAEYLYAYTHAHSVDGVIAFDQQFLVMLLEELGPLEVDGAPYPLTDGNVVEYMRQAKVPPEGEPIPADWYRKEFIGSIADALLMELTEEDTHDWTALAGILSRALAERHLLLQFDDPLVQELTARRGWDNAVRPDGGDFILVTDTNVGFNKTNAVVEVKLSYDVDLTDIHAPVGTLLVTHINNATKDIPCIHWNTDRIRGDESYPIDRCYWSYLRVYKQPGAELLGATPHAIPGDWMLLGRGVTARVDDLEEEPGDAQGFGTLIVVPGGETLSTSFRFDLSGAGLSSLEDGRLLLYRLRIQKQPGTIAIPLTVRVHLPNNAALNFISVDATIKGQNVLIETDLRTDREVTLILTNP